MPSGIHTVDFDLLVCAIWGVDRYPGYPQLLMA